jgi:hypothetical protein
MDYDIEKEETRPEAFDDILYRNSNLDKSSAPSHGSKVDLKVRPWWEYEYRRNGVHHKDFM